MTKAEAFADLFENNGQKWVSTDGRLFGEVAGAMGARPEYSARGLIGAPVRYEFSDGSAIVEAGDCWDLEGPTPFTLAGTR